MYAIEGTAIQKTAANAIEKNAIKVYAIGGLTVFMYVHIHM
jgi:hypothetical protein